MTLLKKYLSAFFRARWYFLTISFQEFLNFESPLCTPIQVYWAACEYALRNMIIDGYFQGAFVLEAFYVQSIWPRVMVLPHVHAVLLADDISLGKIATVTDLVQTFQGEVWDRNKRRYLPAEDPESISVEPTTRTYPLPEMEDSANVLSYLCRPFDIVTGYASAYQTLAENEPGSLILLNQNATDLIAGLENSWADRDGHYYRGQLHSSHRNFPGVAPKERNTKSHERLVRELLIDCAASNLSRFPFEDRKSIEELSPIEIHQKSG